MTATATKLPNERQEVREPAPPRLVLIPWHQMHLPPKRESLIADLLDRGAMSIEYGASGSGKTFDALDKAAHVALGWNWRGRTVRQGAVVYVAAEGGLGIEERLTAFRIHHQIDVTKVPLYVIPEPIDLCRSDADAKLLIQRIRELPPGPPDLELIVVDTLSRALSGGNENDSSDMGKFVAHCDRLRLETKAHVMVIHHAGKDDSRGARGHSLLKAAADTEIEVSKSETGIATATVAKQRDHRTGDTFAFRLMSVEIGQDVEGKSVTSCVVVAADAPIKSAAPKTASMPKAARTALRALAEAINEQGEQPPANGHIPHNAKVVNVEAWRQTAYRMGISAADSTDRARQAAFKRASDYLIGSNRVGFWDDSAWLA
ncbi:MAG: AAA family ATPase [Rhizobiales bacterium]|nr:AAA family ATPase [Hyphomicrobiales bacterium]